MRTGFISVEKGKYTTLLRRVLGMQVSENGVTEMEAIFGTIGATADNARRACVMGATQAELEHDLESIELTLEYYRIRKEEIYGVKVEENSINLCKD
jgi:hypothetical protein